MLSAKRKKQLKQFHHEEWIRGEANYWKVVNEVARRLVAITQDAANFILTADQDRVSVKSLVKATDLKKSTIEKHLKTAIF